MSLFEGKTLLITGGTGSFGNAVLNGFLNTDIGEIRVFSRDEKKQDKILYRRCKKYRLCKKRNTWSGLYFPCSSSQAGAKL